jgi:hypothetical protein
LESIAEQLDRHSVPVVAEDLSTHLGEVVCGKVEGDRLLVGTVLTDVGKSAVDSGMELAFGGTVDGWGAENEVTIAMGILTPNKVQ